MGLEAHKIRNKKLKGIGIKTETSFSEVELKFYRKRMAVRCLCNVWVFYSKTFLRTAISVALTLTPLSHFTLALVIIFCTSSSVKRLRNFMPHLFINTICTIALIKGKYFQITKFWHSSLGKKNNLWAWINTVSDHFLF